MIPIALIITPYEKFIGGAETYNELLSEVLNEFGYEVRYLTAENEARTSSGYVHQFIISILVKLFGLPAITAIRFRMERPDAQLIICNGEHSFGIPALPSVVNIFHGSYFGYGSSIRKHIPWRKRFSLWRHGRIQKIGSKGKFVVSVSDFLTEILQLQGIIVNKTINTSVQKPKKIHRVTARNRYFFAGTYDFYGKGFDILVELGSRGKIIDCFTNMEPGGNLKWIQKIEREELLSRMAEYDCLVFPSRFESFGLVPLEAMSRGTPVVMFDVGIGFHLKSVIPELVISVSLPFDQAVSEFARRLDMVSRNRDSFSIRCLEFADKNYDFSIFKGQWKSVVESIKNES